jgi:hypothetical protein
LPRFPFSWWRLQSHSIWTRSIRCSTTLGKTRLLKSSRRCAPRSWDFVQSAERRCKQQARELATSYQLAFRRRYNLPPTDPRYLDATTEDILTDYWANFYKDNGQEEVEDDDFDLDAVVKSMDDGDWEEVK